MEEGIVYMALQSASWHANMQFTWVSGLSCATIHPETIQPTCDRVFFKCNRKPFCFGQQGKQASQCLAKR